MALIVTMPPLKYGARAIVCQWRSTGRGSSPMSNGARSSTAPQTARVCQPSDASPQPTSPGSSVPTRTKTQSRSPASTTLVETSEICTLEADDIVPSLHWESDDRGHHHPGVIVSRVAFLGLGAMGLPMAGRLVDAGHPLRVWNRTPGRDDDLVAKGADR